MFFISPVHQTINVYNIKTQNVMKNNMRYEMSLAIKKLETVRLKFSLPTLLRHGNRGIAPLILDLSTRRRRVINFMPRLLYPGKDSP
jgi:hypothetical protein